MNCVHTHTHTVTGTQACIPIHTHTHTHTHKHTHTHARKQNSHTCSSCACDPAEVFLLSVPTSKETALIGWAKMACLKAPAPLPDVTMATPFWKFWWAARPWNQDWVLGYPESKLEFSASAGYRALHITMSAAVTLAYWKRWGKE